MRKKYTSEFKAKVALEAIKGLKTVAELSSEYEVHSTMINKWKKQLLEQLPDIFSNKSELKAKNHKDETDELYKHIGQLKVENDFLKQASYRL